MFGKEEDASLNRRAEASGESSTREAELECEVDSTYTLRITFRENEKSENINTLIETLDQYSRKTRDKNFRKKLRDVLISQEMTKKYIGLIPSPPKDELVIPDINKKEVEDLKKKFEALGTIVQVTEYKDRMAPESDLKADRELSIESLAEAASKAAGIPKEKAAREIREGLAMSLIELTQEPEASNLKRILREDSYKVIEVMGEYRKHVFPILTKYLKAVDGDYLLEKLVSNWEEFWKKEVLSLDFDTLRQIHSDLKLLHEKLEDQRLDRVAEKAKRKQSRGVLKVLFVIGVMFFCTYVSLYYVIDILLPIVGLRILIPSTVKIMILIALPILSGYGARRETEEEMYEDLHSDQELVSLVSNDISSIRDRILG